MAPILVGSIIGITTSDRKLGVITILIPSTPFRINQKIKLCTLLFLNAQNMKIIGGVFNVMNSKEINL